MNTHELETQNYGWWLVQADKRNGKPHREGCIKVQAGSAKEAKQKTRDLGYSKIGRAKAEYAQR